jgi:hypothetical protein
VKPWIGYYLYSLVKENKFYQILQIGIRNGIESLYMSLGLGSLEKSPSLKKKKEFVILSEQEHRWSVKRDILKNIPECADAEIIVIEEKNYMVLSEIAKSKDMFDIVIIKGYLLFDHSLIDFIYADKILRKNGVIVLFDAKFDATKKLVKFIETNFTNYKLVPKNLGSEYCYTFVKIKDENLGTFRKSF